MSQVLEHVPEYTSAVKKLGHAPLFCFGKSTHAGVLKSGTLLLPATQDISRSAARAAHLTVHLTDGLTQLVDSPGDCQTTVHQALEKEAQALLVELRILDETKAPPAADAALELEQVYHNAPVDRRETVVRRYLAEHPQGAPGLDGLVAGYTKRCRAASVSTE